MDGPSSQMQRKYQQLDNMLLIFLLCSLLSGVHGRCVLVCSSIESMDIELHIKIHKHTDNLSCYLIDYSITHITFACYKQRRTHKC